MLKIVHGDLFDHAKGDCVIAHGVNPLGVMGDGFAKQIRQRFAANYLEYRHWCYNNKPKLGQWLMVYERVQEDRKIVTKGILNILTQLEIGRDPSVCYVDYDAVQKGLSTIAVFSKTYQQVVHFPFIGSGLANGDKEKLMRIFEQCFKDADGVLYLKGKHP